MASNLPLLNKVKLLSHALNGDGLTESEKSIVADFVKSCIGNRGINQDIQQLKVDQEIEVAVEAVRDITYRTRFEGKASAHEEANANIREYAHVRDLAILQPHIKQLVKQGVFASNDSFVEEVNACAKKKNDLEKGVPIGQNSSSSTLFKELPSAKQEVLHTFTYLVSVLNGQEPIPKSGPKNE